MNEGAFELPAVAMTDRTTHVVEVKRGPHPLTLVVCRFPLLAGKSLRQVAQLRVAEEMDRLDGYSIVAEGDAAWDAVPALEFTSRWRHDGGVVYQRQAYLALGGRWLLFALSTAFEGRAGADAWFEQIRESVRLRSDA